MKTYKYKLASLFLILALSVQAQKFNKKSSKNIKTNSEVIVVVNTSHTDVDIETWNKNKVSIEAVIEVEGLDKDEAQELLDSWNWEALGENGKVTVFSIAEDFDFDFNFDFNFDFPEIDFPEMSFPDFEIPEIEFDEIEFNYDLYKSDTTYLKKYKEKVKAQAEKFKNGDWKKKMDSFKNSEEFKNRIKEMKKQSAEMAKQLKESEWFKKMQEWKNSNEFKKTIEDSKKAAEQIRIHMKENKALYKEQAKMAKFAGEQAKKIIEKMKKEGRFDSINNHNRKVYNKHRYEDDKNVKIRRYLKIKVPTNATLDLNVHHGKLNKPS